MPPTKMYSNVVILKKNNTEIVTLEASNKILVSLSYPVCNMNTFPALTRIYTNLYVSLGMNLNFEL